MIVDYKHIMTNTNNDSKIYYYLWKAGFVTVKRFYHEIYFGNKKVVNELYELPKLSNTWVATEEYNNV